MEGEALKVIKRAFERAPESLQYLKQKSITRLYRYLTIKALAGSPGRQRGLKQPDFLALCQNDPSRFRQKRFKLSLLFDVMAAVLPTQQTAR